MLKRIEQVDEKQFLDELKKENGVGFSIRSRKTRSIDIEVVKNVYKECVGDKSVRFFEDKVTKEINTITFPIKKHDAYCKYRELDMRNDNEPVHGVGTNTPTMQTLNFSKSVIGSDETGTSEIFKPIVVAATYVENHEQLKKWIKMGISDSKDFPNKKGGIGVNPNKKLMKIGEAVTGLSTWNDVLNQMNGDKLIVSDFFAIRVITNKEYNEMCEMVAVEEGRATVTCTGIKEMLLEKAHAEVLSVLKKNAMNAVVVVDDFTDEGNHTKNEKKVEEERSFRNVLNSAMPGTDIYLTTKGDAKIMAVALASVISSYVSQLGIIAAESEFQDVSKIGIDEIPHGALAEKNDKFINSLKALNKERLKNLKPLMETYAKIYYDSSNERVIDRICKVIEEMQ